MVTKFAQTDRFAPGFTCFPESQIKM